jgi:hypothetical protein
MVFLSIHPERLELALRSVRRHLAFIDRIVVLTSPARRRDIESVARRHFAEAAILTDDEIAPSLPADHQARNSWLRKHLYARDCIEANFLAADEDYVALRAVGAQAFQREDVHAGYYFLEDMGTWLAGSPAPTSYDRGVRNAWRLLREAAYPARGFASHMPQLINKSLVNQIYTRFIVEARDAGFDEWSLYFNVAAHLYPSHFTFKPYAVLGWPMRMGDWLPQVAPAEPLFENYYPQNYEPDGMFASLDPLGDVEAKTARYLAALVQARRVESAPGHLVLRVGPTELSFAGGPVIAGRDNVRRVLLLNGATGASAVKGRIEMFLAGESGTARGGESAALGEVCWLPLIPPERAGRYELSFFATLDSGARLEVRAPLEVVVDRGANP